MKTFYAWALVDSDHPEFEVGFATDKNGVELQFASQDEAMAYMTDEVITNLIADGICPTTVELMAYELDVH